VEFQYNDTFADFLIQKYSVDAYHEYTGNYSRQIANTAGKMDQELIMLSVDENLTCRGKMAKRQGFYL
jgi:hypothetical protein